MYQVTYTLDLANDANPSLLKKMIKNMKGVLKVTTHRTKNTNPEEVKDEEIEKWISDIKNFSQNFDSSAIDMNDERTRYIMREEK